MQAGAGGISLLQIQGVWCCSVVIASIKLDWTCQPSQIAPEPRSAVLYEIPSSLQLFLQMLVTGNHTHGSPEERRHRQGEAAWPAEASRELLSAL